MGKVKVLKTHLGPTGFVQAAQSPGLNPGLTNADSKPRRSRIVGGVVSK